MPALAPIPFDAFRADVETLAAAISADAGWQPDRLVGIGRGGLVPATFLSHRLGIPSLSVDLSGGWPAFGSRLLDQLDIAATHGRRFLLVDDINDSGGTIAAVRAALTPAAHEGIRVAVLLDNIRSGQRVDYRARVIDRSIDKRWFVFPWEAMALAETLLADARDVPERLG